MSMQDIYDRFSAQPSNDALVAGGQDATLTYVTSGITITTATEIVQFLARARKDVQVQENVLAAHEAKDVLTLEIAAECKFKNGGSWIVPGIEANMIDDVVAKIALVKVVEFCGGRIGGIRVYWDQGTVLKQLEVVGSRGRGWPITDGPKQIDLINKSLSAPKPQPKPQRIANLPKVVVHDDPNATPKAKTPSRRTYSITDDILIDPEESEIKRLPRQGWQNNRAQAFRVDEEGEVFVKEQSPVRLPRQGLAPRREFSFSNLGEVYRAQETPTKRGAHFEFDEEVPPLPTNRIDFARMEGLYPGEEKKGKGSIGGGTGGRKGVETIFHDADDTPEGDQRPSIGGGTGGRRPEETIFVELAEDSLPVVERKKTPISRRDQQTHFTLTDERSAPVPTKKTTQSHLMETTPAPESDDHARIPRTRADQQTHFTLTDEPSTPAPTKKITLSHIIEGTPVAGAEEYLARALQRKEMNHFRPDTLSHFDLVDDPRDGPQAKKENTESMEKLVNGNSCHWSMTDSPGPAVGGRVGHVKKDLAPHFSFGDSPGKDEEEKENGRGRRPKRMAVPVKSEKEWWET